MSDKQNDERALPLVSGVCCRAGPVLFDRFAFPKWPTSDTFVAKLSGKLLFFSSRGGAPHPAGAPPQTPLGTIIPVTVTLGVDYPGDDSVAT